MPDYRTPEEDRADDERDARIRVVLDQAITDGASCKAAMVLGEPQDVVELWIDRVWDGLRDGLEPEDRIAAIILLLNEETNAGYRTVMRSIGEDVR